MDKLFPHDIQWDEWIEEFPPLLDFWNKEDEITFIEVHRLMRKRNVTNTAPGNDGIKAFYFKKSLDVMIMRIIVF